MTSVANKLHGSHTAKVRTLYESEEITHYAGGDTGSSATVDGIFTETTPSRDGSRGAEVTRNATLEVPDSVTVTIDDTWLIRSELWQTLTAPAASGGYRKLTLQRNDIEHQGRAGGGLR